MGAEPFRLDTLVESVADGTAVDWDAAEAAADEGQRRVIRHLRLVAGIAEVHRTIPDDSDQIDTATRPHPQALNDLAADPSARRWGHLLLLQTIGEGTFGEVYRARDLWLDREVALKLLKPATSGPGRLLAEAQALARIRHPNVVTVHGADLRDGRVGLWMELVRGRTLADIVAADGPLSADEAAIVGVELCRAVTSVHAAGLVHRDIKAQNVMRESGGRLVLMDFGAGHTPLYLAPELLGGSEASVGSDIYALGVLLYYLVTGRFPVAGASIDDLKQAHARGDRRSLAETRPDLPAPFVAAVERALHPDPGQRYRTASEMQAALAPRINGRRSLWIAASAAAAVLTAGVISYVGPRPPVTPALSPAPDIRMVALLPLRSATNEAAYFADGMTEALMQELAGVGALRVISRTSVERARDTGGSLPAIAQALNADAVLEGAVSRSPESVRVSLRLVHAGTDSPVWARTFEQPLRQAFALQRDVAQAVARELSVALRPKAGTPQAVNAQAYDAYLHGQSYLRVGTAESQHQALAYFQQAVQNDSRHARAHAGIAQAYLVLGGTLGAMPRDAAFQRARDAAKRGLDVEADLAEAHAVLAEISFESDWDWAAAEGAFKRALTANPSHGWAHDRYAMFLVARGRLDEALAQIEQARKLDPLSPDVAAATATVLRYARRYSEAEAQLRRALAANPRHLRLELGLAHTLNVMGRAEEALEHFRNISGSSRASVLAEIALAEISAGRTQAAVAVLEGLKRGEAEAGWTVPPHLYAYVHGRLGEIDEAFRFLEQAFQRREGGVLWLNVDPRADPLRSDARFATYLRRLGLQP